MKELLKNRFLKRSLVVFVVGLVLRVVISLGFDINILVDNMFISYILYATMGCFGYMLELPIIGDYLTFNSKLYSFLKECYITGVTKVGKILYLEGDLCRNEKMLLDDFTDCGRVSKDKSDDYNTFFHRKGSDISEGRMQSYSGSSRRTPAGIKGLYGDPQRVKLLDLSDNKEEHKKSVKLEDDGVKRRHRRNKHIPERKDRVVLDESVTRGDSKIVHEIDGCEKKVYELDSRSVHELYSGIQSDNRGQQNYIPYRPAPVELDTNQPKDFNPWSPDSYNSREEVKNHHTDVENSNGNYQRSLYDGSTYNDNFYLQKRERFSNSTKLGEIYSPDPSEERRYVREHPGNRGYYNVPTTINKSKRGKVVEKLLNLIIK